MKSNKSFDLTLFLAIMGGIFGLHRFYVGKIFTGLLMFFTYGLFGIMYIVDIVNIALGRFTDSKGNVISYSKKKHNVNNNRNDVNNGAIDLDISDNEDETIILNKNNDETIILNDEEFNNYFDNMDGAIKYK